MRKADDTNKLNLLNESGNKAASIQNDTRTLYWRELKYMKRGRKPGKMQVWMDVR